MIPYCSQINGYINGSVRCHQEIYMVFAGDAEFIRNVLLQGKEAPAIRIDTASMDFRSHFVLPDTAYTMFIPRHDIFHGPLFGRLGFKYHTLPVVCYGDEEGWALHPDVIDEWRALELNMCAVAGAMNRRCRSERPRIIPYPAPYRFGFEKKRYTEVTARRVAMKSIQGFLPLVGQLGLFFFLFAASEDLSGSNWRSDVISDAKVHPAWFDELERVVGDWTLPRVGGVVDLRPAKTPHSEYTPKTKMDFLLGSIITFDIPLPLYLRFGDIDVDPRESRPHNPLPLTLEALPFFPDNEEIQYLKQIPGVIAFSQWEVTNDVCLNYPGNDIVKKFRSRREIAPFPMSHSPVSNVLQPMSHSPVSRASPVSPWFAVEKYSGQRAGEEMSKFFARRNTANEGRRQTENAEQRAAHLQREAHAAKGGVPGNKGAKVFVWMLVAGHRIRQAAGRRNYSACWDEYSPSQRIYDSFRDEWDLCEAFEHTDSNIPESPVSDYDDGGIDDLPSLLPETNTTDFTRVGPHTSEADLQRIHGIAALPNEIDNDPVASPSLRFGYAVGVTQPAFATSQLPSNSTVAKILGNKDINLPHTPTLNRLKIFFAQSRKAVSLQMITSDLLEATETRLLCSAMDVTAFDHRGTPHYCIREADEPGRRCVVVSSAITTLEIVRNEWGSDMQGLCEELLSRGIAFKFCILNPCLPPLRIEHSTPHYDYRPKGYKPDKHDYAAYTDNRDRFLASSRGPLALRYGGIVARIARSVLGLGDGAFHPTDEAADNGVSYHDIHGEETCWDAELTPDEIDLICGVYHVATGQRDIHSPRNRQTTIISWWPRPINFVKSGINVGWWSPACESFYQRRLAQIANGQTTLPSQIEWKNNLRFDNKVPLYMEGFENCARMMLKDSGL
ncbi:hypothetical protein R3P38DRAFT_2564359 [Favolaschia claudopus]|uniref:Uncharacterized protein n=1 Tax=Favolaschia claudopus TaxID=2862362 RepID=A0AAW0A0X9_9AGAR